MPAYMYVVYVRVDRFLGPYKLIKLYITCILLTTTAIPFRSELALAAEGEVLGTNAVLVMLMRIFDIGILRARLAICELDVP